MLLSTKSAAYAEIPLTTPALNKDDCQWTRRKAARDRAHSVGQFRTLRELQPSPTCGYPDFRAEFFIHTVDNVGNRILWPDTCEKNKVLILSNSQVRVL